MLLSKIDSENLTDEQIEKILFSIPEDDKEIGDCIFVFGSKNYIEERTNLAIKLYKEKRAPKILFSGGLGKSGEIPEAILMKEIAIKNGVPEEDILIEEVSNNTTENILSSMLVLEREFLLQNINRLIIVSSPAHIKRCMLTLSRYMPKWIKYSYCYDENSVCSKDNWKKDDVIKERVQYEGKGIIFYAKERYIDDVEI